MESVFYNPACFLKALVYILNTFFLLLIATYKIVSYVRNSYFTWTKLIVLLILNISSFYYVQGHSQTISSDLSTILVFVYLTTYIATFFTLLQMLNLLDEIFDAIKNFIGSIFSFIVSLFVSIIWKFPKFVLTSSSKAIIASIWTFPKYILTSFTNSNKPKMINGVLVDNSAVVPTQPTYFAPQPKAITNTTVSKATKSTITKVISTPKIPFFDGKTVLYNASGKMIKIDKDYFAKGGEANIHNISKRLIAKIYHQGKATKNKLNVAHKLINANLPANVIVPIEVLYDENNNHVGYKMKRVAGVELGLLLLQNGIIKHFPKYNLLDVIELCITIVDTFKSINDESIICGDINPRNILVKDKRNISVIDVDSFQIGRPATTGLEEYTRQIHYGKSFDSYMRTIEDDAYAIATIIFQLLHRGSFPFGGTDTDSIQNGIYLYHPTNKSTNNVQSELVDAHHNLSHELRVYFYTQFANKQYVSITKLLDFLYEYRQDVIDAKNSKRGGKA